MTRPFSSVRNAMFLVGCLSITGKVLTFSSTSGHVAPPSWGASLIHPTLSTSSSLTFSSRPLATINTLNQLHLSATTEDTLAGDVAIRNMDKKMEEYNRQKEKVVAKLNKMEEKLETLQKKKQEYLEGMKLGVAEKNFSETTVRSAVKAFMWRIIAGSVTFFTSLRFSGSVSTALSIVGSDFLSKSVTMFVGERLMNKSKAGRKGGADDVGRSLAKALIWRLFAIANTLTMSFVIAKDLSMASKIAGSDAIFKTALMFAYERAWAKVEWGKEYIIEFSI